MEWNLLAVDKAEAFIQIVKDDRYPGLFDTNLLRVQYYPLNFYKNAYLYALDNQCVEPSFQLLFLKNGNDLAFLDGSAAPFENFNAKGLLILNSNNVTDYLEIYCQHVIQRPNNVLLLRNIGNMPFYGDHYIDFHFDKNNYGEKDIKIRKNDQDNSYIIEAPFVFDGKIDPATAFITETGDVRVERRAGR